MAECEIVIPCFRESERLPRFLRALLEELDRRELSAAVTVVDDGSGTKDVEIIDSLISDLQEHHSSRLHDQLKLPENRGKGGAVYAGWHQALQFDPELLLMVDADGSYSEGELCRALEHFQRVATEGVEAVIGSRVRMLGRHVDRTLPRHLLGRTFATFVTQITGMAVYDSQAGLKMVSAKAYRDVAPFLKETQFVFDVELILALLQRGHRIQEFPIDYYDIEGSKVRVVRDSCRMFSGLWRIRKNLGTLSKPRYPRASETSAAGK